MTSFRDLDLYFLQTGEHSNLFEKMGAHPVQENGQLLGFHFRVYAPQAQDLLVGDFNHWQTSHPMVRHEGGIFELFVPDLPALSNYKYRIMQQNGQEVLKADPYAFYSQVRPATASVTYQSHYSFQDDFWMYHRVNYDMKSQPLSIYELHLGSWRQKMVNKDENGAPASAFYTYRELAPLIIEHVLENGFTHIEVLPLMEHPLDASWGYQVTGYFSPTSRYGEPDDLKYLIDQCHQAGIGVILDWVPLHFCKDSHGLSFFDGSPLYEYSQEQDRENHQWGTANFDLAKGSTQSFLLSNIKYWLQEFHFDGIRVDALSYLLYWRGETEAEKENGPAIAFIKRVNALVHQEFKGVLMIAEDSSNFPGVTHALEKNGLGFDLKWDLGWMNDTLSYLKRPAVYRQYHTKSLTFGMYYNQNEQYVLPLSHDEVVHGKLSIINKMDGNYEDKFHLARTYYAYMYAHPGKKLLFMGNEWGHIREWHEYTEMDWVLKLYPIHDAFYRMMQTLLNFYRHNDALWQYDFQAHTKGFSWVSIQEESNFFAFRRLSDQQELLILTNFNDQELHELKLNLPDKAVYKLVFSSNALPTEDFSLRVENGTCTVSMPRYTCFYMERQNPEIY